MIDFASSAMAKVLLQGMRDFGMVLPYDLSYLEASSAHIPLDIKRTVVLSALQQGGVSALLQLGRGVERYTHEPTHRALASAKTVEELLVRWARLERYIHSRHRITWHVVDARKIVVRHAAIGQGNPPLAVEDYVVVSVLAALMKIIGAQNVTVLIGNARAYPVTDVPLLERVEKRGGTAKWTFMWSEMAGHQGIRHEQQPTLLAEAEEWPDLAKRAFNILLVDLMTPKSLRDVASELHMASRTFQRALGQCGLSYSKLLAIARSRVAAWWLVHTKSPFAEVGFLCGYADQPHFTRDFQQRVGLTPAKYRQEFAIAD